MAARPCEPTFAGAVYRQSSPRYAEISERTLLASLGTGGRFNPTGEFGALYVSLDPETPFRELRRQVVKAGLTVLDFLPRTLFAADARLERVLDLACADVPAEYRLSARSLGSDDWTACQDVARRARAAGYEAIRFPSATGSGENLAVFLDRLAPGSYVRIIRGEEVRPGRT
ncbi:MAG TPA: RES family NAD+ phosphorylase [Longimicrobium sp.]|nr:RES family NAD+ phosphorylase [Longimicrobium sp.]